MGIVDGISIFQLDLSFYVSFTRYLRELDFYSTFWLFDCIWNTARGVLYCKALPASWLTATCQHRNALKRNFALCLLYSERMTANTIETHSNTIENLKLIWRLPLNRYELNVKTFNSIYFINIYGFTSALRSHFCMIIYENKELGPRSARTTKLFNVKIVKHKIV